jgi:spoIIIJ-associated protein
MENLTKISNGVNLSSLDKIEETIREFFEKMGFEVEIEVKTPQDLTIPIDLKAEEPQILIGKQGETLLEIQHLLKIILKKQIAPDKNFYIDLDVNDYKKKKIEYLKEMARAAADEVSLSKREKTLTPMPAYERRIIHLELADREDVATESIGQGLEKEVVIKPSL